jgi:hypothetical protein
MVGGYNYWYADRVVQVETVPPDAVLGLYYLRQNFQKRFVQAQAPTSVKLPPRADTTPKDAVKFHATANGYLAQDVSFDSRDVPERVTITLHALPNSLVFLGQTSFAGRTSITLRTTEQPEVRLTKSARMNGFTMALSKTALKLDGPVSGSGARLKSIDATQVGEDAMVRVETDSPDVEVRSSRPSTSDLALCPSSSGSAGDVHRRTRRSARPSRRSVRPRRGVRRALRVRAALEGRRSVIAVLQPSGEIADLYRREAMLQLGRFRQGTVRTDAGETLHRKSTQLALAMRPREPSAATSRSSALSRAERARSMRCAPGRPQLPAAEFAPIFGSRAALSCHR